MHCELIVPGLFAQVGGTRAPALELLLARGRGESAESMSPETWLQQAFGLEDEPVAAGALTVLADDGDPGEACWARADPVHLRLMRERLIVVPSEAFELRREEADALLKTLNRHFTGVLHLQASEPRRWCARLEGEFSFGSVPPIEAAGRDVDLASRIGGEEGKRWARLVNEAQMLLHAHPVNEEREARGEPTVNSLWLWGAGRKPQLPAAPWRSVSSNDPLLRGLARLAGVSDRALPDSAAAWLTGLAGEGRHLVWLDALRAPLALEHTAEMHTLIEALEAAWFAPLLAALRSGRIGMISVHVPDCFGASFETTRGDLRRFWRRRRSLESYA